MDRKNMLKLLVGTVVTLHLGFYFVKPLILPPTDQSRTSSLPERPSYR